MPKNENANHLKAYQLYMEMGGMSPAFFARFRIEFGKSRRTAYDWEKSFGWKERAKQPLEEALENLQEAGTLDAEELVSGFLDLCRARIEDAGLWSEYFKGIFATAFERIPNPENPEPENPLVVGSIRDMVDLARAQTMLMRTEQAWVRLCLTLVGEPERIMEDRMIVELVGMTEDDFTSIDQSVADTSSEVPEKGNEADVKT